VQKDAKYRSVEGEFGINARMVNRDASRSDRSPVCPCLSTAFDFSRCSQSILRLMPALFHAGQITVFERRPSFGNSYLLPQTNCHH
jgi:hypothetical protein